jgi:glycyl-radical enzyme activating protein
MGQSELTGVVFDIQGFSVHDGPGCRTLVFLKGCSLSCHWCCNPEGKNRHVEPFFRRNLCTSDMLCAAACPAGAITPAGSFPVINRSACTTCLTFACSDACCTQALRKGGKVMTVDEIYAVITRDRQYWGSGGGLTLTGGEPFLQPDFALAILQRSHQAMIHTAAETCGAVPWASIEPSLPFLDWLFFDIKHLNPEKHREGTGRSNRQILQNARRLAREFPGRMVYRLVVIPGFNDMEQHLLEVAGFILSTGRAEINILPLHHLGREKYALLGLPYYTDELSFPAKESLSSVARLFESKGIPCYTGSETPF